MTAPFQLRKWPPSRAPAIVVVVLAAIALTGVCTATAGAATADLLDVVALGGTSSSATPVTIVPLLATGVTGTPIALPTATSGANFPLTMSASAGSEGALALSADGRYLTLLGYPAAPGTAAVKGTARRVVGRIDGSGAIDTSTSLDVFKGDNPRGAVTDDGSRFWLAGAGSTDNPKTALYYATLGASTGAPVVGPSPTGARVPVIAGGSLYLSTSTTITPGIYKVGSGLPTSTAALSALQTATSDPYGFALVRMAAGAGAPDTLYVANGSNGDLRKFSLQGATWVARGSIAAPAQITGLAGRVSGASVALYATALDGSKVYAFTDTSGASNAPIAGTFATIATAPAGTVYRGIAFAPSGQIPPGPAPTATLSDTALGGVLGDPGHGTIGVTLADADPNVQPSDLTVSLGTSNPAVAPLAGMSITGTGASRTIVVQPAAKGKSTITLTVTAPDGHSGSAQFTYGASSPAPDTTSHWLDGASDASTALDAGNGYILVGDDSSNILRLYRGDVSGVPAKSWDFSSQLGVTDQMDIEGATRRGNTIYWIGSLGNSSSGNLKPDKSTLFATTVSGTGASTELALAGFYKSLRSDLIAWDQSNGHGLGVNALGFAAGAAQGQIPKEINGFNVEGLELAPAASSTAYAGFRAPLLPAANRHLALVVPVTNLTSLTSGAAKGATFGAPILWDLDGLSVREIRKNADDEYLVVAGSYAAGGSFALYACDGDPAHQPVPASSALPAPLGSWETIVAVPDPLLSGSLVRFIEDDGDVDFYGDGSAAKDLALGLRKARIDTLAVTLAAQAIAFTSQPPAQAVVGGIYAVSATGGASGKPVVFAIDPASSPGACSIAGAAVSLTGTGTCTIDADQAASGQYAAAPRVVQSFTVMPLATSAPATVSATVASLLAISVGNGNPSLGTFLPNVAGDYATTFSAGVTTSGLQTTLSVADPSAGSPGHLVNGPYTLSGPLQAKATDAANPSAAFAPVGSAASPLALLSYPTPVSSDAVTVELRQSILATEPLLRGSYAKTIVFSLSAATP